MISKRPYLIAEEIGDLLGLELKNSTYVNQYNEHLVNFVTIRNMVGDDKRNGSVFSIIEQYVNKLTDEFKLSKK